MNKISKARLIMWVLALAPAIIVAVLYNSLPDMIPMHWNARGEVRYDPKMHIWIMAMASPAIAALFMLLPKIDPRKENYEKFREYYDRFALFIMLFMLGVLGLILSESFNPGRLRVDNVVLAVCGLLFMFLGNMMPKLKSNFFIGIRTPWTISNADVWHKTHRLAGFLWFFGGLLVLASSFILSGTPLFAMLTVTVAAMTFIPIVMSYLWYKGLPDTRR